MQSRQGQTQMHPVFRVEVEIATLTPEIGCLLLLLLFLQSPWKRNSQIIVETDYPWAKLECSQNDYNYFSICKICGVASCKYKISCRKMLIRMKQGVQRAGRGAQHFQIRGPVQAAFQVVCKVMGFFFHCLWNDLKVFLKKRNKEKRAQGRELGKLLCFPGHCSCCRNCVLWLSV